MAKRHAQTKASAEPTVSAEELGIAEAYRHPAVTKHPKYSVTRRVAKDFIKQYGQEGHKRQLTKFDNRLARELEMQVLLDPKSGYAGTDEWNAAQAGVKIAWQALVNTYTGPKKPARAKVDHTQPPVRNVIKGHLRPGQARIMHRMAGAPVRQPYHLGEHIVLSDN